MRTNFSWCESHFHPFTAVPSCTRCRVSSTRSAPDPRPCHRPATFAVMNMTPTVLALHEGLVSRDVHLTSLFPFVHLFCLFMGVVAVVGVDVIVVGPVLRVSSVLTSSKPGLCSHELLQVRVPLPSLHRGAILSPGGDGIILVRALPMTVSPSCAMLFMDMTHDTNLGNLTTTFLQKERYSTLCYSSRFLTSCNEAKLAQTRHDRCSIRKSVLRAKTWMLRA